MSAARPKKMLSVKSLLKFTCLLVLLLVLLLLVLVSTATGSGWLLNTANRVIQQAYPQLTIEPGTPRALIKGFNLNAFSWQSAGTTIDGRKLDLQFSLFCLNSTAICVEQLAIDYLSVVTTPTSETEPTPAAAGIELPSIAAPVPFHIKQIDLKQFDYGASDASAWLKNIRWQASGLRWQDKQLDINASSLGNALWQHSMSGTITLDQDYPLHIEQSITLAPPELPKALQADITLAESVAKLQANIVTNSPQQLTIDARVEPLQPALPLTLTLQAAEFTPALWYGTAQSFSSRDVHIELDGNLEKLAFNLASMLQNHQAGALRVLPLRASGWASPTDLNLDQLLLGEQGKGLSLTGKVEWQPKLQGQFKLALRQFNPADIWPMPLSRLHGAADIAFAIDTDQRHYEINSQLQDLQFNFNDATYTANGKVSTNARRVIEVEQLALSSDKNAVQLSGEFAPPGEHDFKTASGTLAWLRASAFNAQINAADLSEAASHYGGSLQLQLKFPSDRALGLKGAAQALVLPWLAAEQLVIDGRIIPDLEATQTSLFSLQGSNVHLAGGLWQSLQLQANGNSAAHRLLVQANGDNKRANMQLSGRYTPTAQRWQGTVEQLQGAVKIRDINSTLQLEQAVPIAWQARHPLLQLGAFCLRLDSGKLCTKDTRYADDNLVLDFSLQQFDFASLQPLLPENIRWTGTLSGNGRVQQASGKPLALQLELQGSPGTIASNGLATPVQLNYQTLQLEARSSAQRFDTRLTLLAQQQSRVQASLSLLGKNFGQLKSDIRIENFPLGILAPLVPAAEIAQARLDLDLDASGSSAAPVLLGTLSLAEGQFKLKRNASYLTDIQLLGNFNNKLLDLSGSFNAGEGSGRIDGQLDFGQPVQGQIKLFGERLQIDSRPLFDLWSDFDIEAVLSANTLSITGEVAIPEGKIEIQKLPRSAQSLSRDVTFVNLDEKKPRPTKAALQVATNLDLVLGPKLAFSGFDASAQLDGRLVLTQLAGKPPQGSGEINIVEGKYRGYGQKLDVRRGVLRFNGPLSAPAIDVEAVRQVSDAVVGIHVQGPAREPELTPFSEPPLPDDEIIFRMVTGRVPGTKTTSSENQLIAQALVSSGIKFGGASISETAEKLGIQNFNVGTGDESDLLVSGYLDPSLYVEYGVNALGDGSTFKVRWDFARKMSLEMIGGLQSSLDLLYSREF